MLVVDELSISDDDKKKIERGETSEIEETLTWLADITAMTLAALSSTALLDDIRESALSQTGLDEMIKRTGYKAVTLPNIMRSCANIAKAASPESINKIVTNSSVKIKETITAGSSSTVPGRRPLAMVYRDTGNDYTKQAKFVSQHLKTLPTDIKVAVLCDREISVKRLTGLLRREITTVACYDGGVEEFKYGGAHEYREERGEDGGLAELTQWLRDDSGILVTHERQYRGCEADAVILMTEVWASGYSGANRRSGVTRGVAHSALVTSDEYIWEMREHGWDVEVE